MGRRGKNQWRQQGRRVRGGGGGDDDDGNGDLLPSAAYEPETREEDEEEEEGEMEEEEEEEAGEERGEEGGSTAAPSKFLLYQKSVQVGVWIIFVFDGSLLLLLLLISPRGDISYMQKFFLTYVGGRMPLHLQEDFCGTALLSAEWLRSDPRRTAVGLDLDDEALDWCLKNNLNKIGPDGYSRIFLFHGNVLHPKEACLMKPRFHDLVTQDPVQNANTEISRKNDCPLPPNDIVCAFNYSCCCLHRRADLVLYFKHALDSLSRRGGIFVMDLYGGSSSECKLKLQRRFSDFTYVWEQQAFDIVSRTTRISLHFHMGKRQILRHAFSYHWRLFTLVLEVSVSWSLPEIKDCLEEAGFQSVHFWLREMPDTRQRMNSKEYNAGNDVKYEEVSSFQQTDAWNAYVVGVAHHRR
ncbi:hypothetical protein Taro_008485 [Colocasia esculenta]|uniref:S-adenosyl-L-methionine-dependent methyltransferase superfamily protein n=1 Tax=Colocasia esculenta TaxID=4460 RepID=A0A843TTS5_COLES|nr:hypothetical protein [Colocasia esculenta]